MKCVLHGLFVYLMFRFGTIMVLVMISFAQRSRAQEPQPEDDFQSWKDIQLPVPINAKLEFQTQGTFRFGKNITRLNDARYAIGIVVKPNKAFSINPFYWFIRARNSNSIFQTEHRLNLRFVYRFPVKGFGLSHRSWFEYRIRQPVNSLRYRPSITIEKDLPKRFISNAKLFLIEEPFYDSIQGRFSRNRLSIGVNKTINSNLSLDVFYMRQNDGLSRPGDIHVIGTAWKFKL